MKAALAALALLPVTFAPHAGWHPGHGREHACVGVSAARCVQASTWTATVPWRGCGECLPHRTIEALPPDGIALQVTAAIEHPPVAPRAPSWPPRIRARDVVGGFEGVSSRYGVYQSLARFGRTEAYVWAFFGRAHPTHAQLAAANAELRTVRLAAAADPWQLDCPSTPLEQPPPAAVRHAALRFFPWVRPVAKSLHVGPVYLIALSSRTSISRDGDDTDTADYYVHRALVAIAPTHAGTVTVTGRRLGPAGLRTTLGFSQNGATSCTVHPPDVACGYRQLRFGTALRIAPHPGWRIVPTELRIGRTGCFELIVSGPGLHETIPLAVPGPDYRPGGW
jgi:hypothetical protein